MLHTYANTNSGVCPMWGQPALMVTSALTPPVQTAPISAGTPVAYMAAECFTSSFQGTYHVFYTTDLTLASGWTAYVGPFNETALTVAQ